MSFRRLPEQVRAKGRRDFLAWLAVTPVGLAACSSSDTPAEPSPASPPQDAGGPPDAAAGGTECRLTTRDAEGPYYEAGSPSRVALAGDDEAGVRLAVEGRLFGPDCTTPLVGYAIDVWQADASGTYYDAAANGHRLRGKVVTDGQGRYRFETVLPGRYGDAAGIRPAHLHAKVLTPMGGALLTTQIYFAGDPYLGQADYCTRSGTCNSGDPGRVLLLEDAEVSGRAGKRARFDAFLRST